MKKKRARSGQSSPETGAGTVRERTLAHLENLMLAATTVGTGIVMACGNNSQTARQPQVCDPVPPPPPASCENPDEFLVRGCISQRNNWVKSGARWTLQLGLFAQPGPARISFEGLKRGAIKLSGVSIKQIMKVEPRNLALVLTPGAKTKEASLEFPVLYNDKAVTVTLVLDLSKPPAENGSVPVKLAK